VTQTSLSLSEPVQSPGLLPALDLASVMLDTTIYPGQFVVLHTLTTVAGVSLNRDAANMPKRITYGGVARMRVSPQARLRAARDWSRDYLNQTDRAELSRLLPKAIAEILMARYSYEPAEASYGAAAILTAVGFGVDWARPDMITSLVRVPTDAAQRLAELAHQQWDRLAPERTAAQKQIDTALAAKASRRNDENSEPSDTEGVTAPTDPVEPRSSHRALRKEVLAAFDPSDNLELALYGRMMANMPDARVTGATQVAHSFSVDPIAEFADAYTALDDWQGDEVFGAANRGDQFLASGTLYGYAALDRRQLRATLTTDDPERRREQARRAEQVFLTAMIRAVPGSRRTRTGSTAWPTLIVAAATDSPITAAAAFETAVDAPAGVLASHRLAEYLHSLQRPGRAPLRGGVVEWVSPDGSAVPSFPDILTVI
jgi:CRISPR system Cascade subunit CasC